MTTRSDMPDWVPGLLRRIVLTILITLGALWLVRELRSLLINIVIALFLSFAFEPAVQFLARRGWNRGLATGAVFLVALAMAIGFFAVMLPPILRQAGALVDRVPEIIEEYGPRIEESLEVDLSLEALADSFGNVGDFIERYATTVTERVAGVASAAGRFVISALTVGLFTFYLLADGPRLRTRVLASLPPERQREVARIWALGIQKTGGYVYSRLLLAGISAVVTAVALAIIRVPDALALGIWVGVISQFVPAVGTYIAAIVPLFVALVDDPVKAIWVLVVLVAYQQVENILVAPRITARTMSLHPAVGFGAAIAGITLMGAIGALIALPTVAIIQAFVSAYLEQHPVAASPLTSDHHRDDGPAPAMQPD